MLVVGSLVSFNCQKWDIIHNELLYGQPARKARQKYSHHHHCQHHACDCPGERGQQCAHQRVAGLCDLCRKEVYTHSVENRLRAAHQDGCQHTRVGIRAGGLKYIEDKPVV
mgnify:CR=1 FL=1